MSDALELPGSLSRRGFLKFSSFAMLSLGLPVRWQRPSFGLEAPELGRIVTPTVEVYSRPTFASSKRKTYWRDDVLTLAGAALGDRVPEYNRIWYEVDGQGFVHSSAVQPVKNQLNTPRTFVPYRGLLMEVTVPMVEAYWEPKKSAERAYRFYYASTHWINGVSRDSKDRLWYRIYDDKYMHSYYGRAENFRPIPSSELSPISRDVPLWHKRIEVDLARQLLHCYEDSEQVFTTKISSGRVLEDGSYWTPDGDYITFRKRPSRHMVSGNLATGYDLPGVPWVCYITEYGVAFHGTYWHNDYGAPRSHGCINMTPAASKWLYRWTRPIVPTTEMESWVSYGTRVKIQA